MHIGLLGTLVVLDETGEPVRVGGHRVRTLLILLALEPGRVVPSWSLTQRLWPEDPPADAPNALQTLISRLRTALRGVAVIESHPAGYRLAAGPAAVDAAEFEEAARRGSAALARGDAAEASAALRQALSLWRGPALADVSDYPFASGPAARLEELRQTAVADRIEADLALGEEAGLIAELRSMTADRPLAERPRVLLMRALQAAGRQADALEVYAQAREVLADELGMDPSPELEQAYLAVLRQDSGPERPRVTPPGQPRQPPPGRGPLSSFVGRESDLAGVRKQLHQHRLVTLTGPGGIGKTRLALEVAGGPDSPLPVPVIELARVTAGADVPFAALEALGMRDPVIAPRSGTEPAGDPAERLCAALGGTELVMILDNCEHVIQEAAELAERVLTRCPRVRILATSREPLRIGGETLWPVGPLAVPPDDPGQPAGSGPPDTSDVSSYAAMRLLRDRAAAVSPGLEVDEGNAVALARICRALDGMPLAIELAAVWLRVLSPAQLAERLDDRFALLRGGSRTALPRHQTLRAVVDWSWELLEEPERALARRLSVFPGGATLAAAEGVCADSDGLPAASVLAALSGLVDKSILFVASDPGGGGSRYRMLETVRAYGAERLAEAGEDERVRSSFAAYYLHLAETADAASRTADQIRWFAALTAEQDNMHAALRWAIARRDDVTAYLFVRALGWYWMLSSTGEGEGLAREVLDLPLSQESLRTDEGRVIAALTLINYADTDIDVIVPLLRDAVATLDARAADWQVCHPIAVSGESMLALLERDVERAVDLLDRGLTSDDPWLRAAARLYRAGTAQMFGQDEHSEENMLAALGDFRAVGDVWGMSTALFALAEYAAQRADYATAITAAQEARDISRNLFRGDTVGNLEGKVAALRLRAGDLAGARESLSAARQALAQRPALSSYADIWLNLVESELAEREGDLASAMSAARAALAGLQDKASAWWQSTRALVLTRLAMQELAAGEVAASRRTLADALSAACQAVEWAGVAAALEAVAVLAARDDGELAARLLGAAHTIRGTFDESSLDAPAARQAAAQRIGGGAFEAACQRGRELPRDDAVALAQDFLR